MHSTKLELQLSNAIDSAENSQDFKTATKTLKISSEIKKKEKKGIRECFSPCMGSGDIFLYLNNICVCEESFCANTAMVFSGPHWLRYSYTINQVKKHWNPVKILCKVQTFFYPLCRNRTDAILEKNIEKWQRIVCFISIYRHAKF